MMLSELICLSLESRRIKTIGRHFFLSSPIENIFRFGTCWWKIKLFTFWRQMVRQLHLARTHLIRFKLIRYFSCRRQQTWIVAACYRCIFQWTFHWWQISWYTNWLIDVLLLLFLLTILVITIQSLECLIILRKRFWTLLLCTWWSCKLFCQLLMKMTKYFT